MHFCVLETEIPLVE
uniref:Uncharacterized protein n=1 Tax=Rhizophora mucronata TaxID=61149 RepID=A0A2P2IYD6_RHIMU